MSRAPEYPASRVRHARPPVAAILAAVGVSVVAVPVFFYSLLGLFFLGSVLVGFVRMPWTWIGDPGEVLERALALQGSLVAVGSLALLVTGVVRLLTRRDRRLLVVSCLSTPLVAGVAVVLTDGWDASLVLLLFPVSAAVPALSPSVSRWLGIPSSSDPARHAI